MRFILVFVLKMELYRKHFFDTFFSWQKKYQKNPRLETPPAAALYQLGFIHIFLIYIKVKLW